MKIRVQLATVRAQIRKMKQSRAIVPAMAVTVPIENVTDTLPPADPAPLQSTDPHKNLMGFIAPGVCHD